MDVDEDLESPEDTQPSGFDALPPETQKEIKKLRKEQESLRARLKERDNEVLTAKYGEDIVTMIPEEVTTYERRAELAEIYKAKLAPVAEATNEAETEAPAEPAATEPMDSGLAAVSGAPTPGSQTAGELLTVAQIKELAKTDPLQASRLVNEGKFKTATPL